MAFLRCGHALGSKRPGWLYPSAQWVQQTQQLLDLDRRLAAVQAGKEKPKDAQERLDLGLFCVAYRQRYVAAVGFFAEAFQAAPKLAGDLTKQHRYNAACAAALASAGKDAGKLDDKQRSRFRRQSLDWLRADLDAYTVLVSKVGGRQLVRQNLTHWLKDEDFVGVRGEKAVAALPESERKEWLKLWADVAALLKKVEPKK